MILGYCKDPKAFSEIKEEFGWSDGATYNTLRQMITRGVLEKRSEGIYATTAKGLDEIKEKLREDTDIDSKEIDSIVNRVVASHTRHSKIESLETLRLFKDVLHPPKETKELRDVIKKIYVESVRNSHHNNPDLIKAMWTSHRDMVCDDHDFDFDSVYEMYSSKVKPHISKEDLFRNLRWQSFSDKEKLKYGLNIKSKYTKSSLK